MITIRKNAFETNSSSCHVITFNNEAKINLENITTLTASASGQYVGSDNYEFDFVEDNIPFEYDAGDYLKGPQEKFDYALVCYIEYLNNQRRNTKDIDEELLYTKNLIIDGFKKHNIDIDWKIPRPNKNGRIDISGYIDHSSSVIENVSDAWELAEMCKRPEELFDFVFRPSNKIFIQCNG